MSHAGPFSAARLELFCGAAGSNIGEESPTPSKTPPHVHVTSLIPTLCRVLQQIDVAHGKSRINYRYIFRQDHPRQKTQSSEWPAWTNSSRTRLCIVNQMRALQVYSVRPEISQLQRGLGA